MCKEGLRAVGYCTYVDAIRLHKLPPHDLIETQLQQLDVVRWRRPVLTTTTRQSRAAEAFFEGTRLELGQVRLPQQCVCVRRHLALAALVATATSACLRGRR